MKLKVIATGTLLLLSILVALLVQCIVIDTVNAYYGAGVFCPNNYISNQWPWDTPDEINFSTTCCWYISAYLFSHYYPGQVYYKYGDPFDNDPIVTPDTYMDCLDYLEEQYSAVTVFSKGHCSPWGYGGLYRRLHCTINGTYARDSIEIYPHTDQFKCRFNFIWHCGTTNSYPYWPPFPPDGPPSMPFAFTHNLGMTEYGNSGSCVFAGWDYASPQFYTVIPDHYPWQWGQLAVAVFYYMHYNYWSLGYTLNYLSNLIYGVNFNQSPLYNELIVLGNMDMPLNY
ncbi:MAG: hypothetical protein QW744_07335 [Candidatus Bathyarchaeia archaeon]